MNMIEYLKNKGYTIYTDLRTDGIVNAEIKTINKEQQSVCLGRINSGGFTSVYKIKDKKRKHFSTENRMEFLAHIYRHFINEALSDSNFDVLGYTDDGEPKIKVTGTNHTDTFIEFFYTEDFNGRSPLDVLHELEEDDVPRS